MIYSTMVVSRLCALAYWQNWNPGSWCLVLCRFEDQSFYCAPSGPEGSMQKKRICFYPSIFIPASIPKQHISILLKELLPKNNSAVVTQTKSLITFMGLLCRSH